MTSPVAGRQQRDLRTLPCPRQQQAPQNGSVQTANSAKKLRLTKVEAGLRPLREKAEINPELQRRPERSHHGAGMNAPGQRGQALARQACSTPSHSSRLKMNQRIASTPAQVGVRPGHAAQRVGHQRQRQPHHGMPAQRLAPSALLPEEQQGRAQRAERHDDGLQRVLQHLLVRHAERGARNIIRANMATVLPPSASARQGAGGAACRRRDRPAARRRRRLAAGFFSCGPWLSARAPRDISMWGMPASSNGSPRG